MAKNYNEYTLINDLKEILNNTNTTAAVSTVVNIVNDTQGQMDVLEAMELGIVSNESVLSMIKCGELCDALVNHLGASCENSKAQIESDYNTLISFIVNDKEALERMKKAISELEE